MRALTYFIFSRSPVALARDGACKLQRVLRKTTACANFDPIWFLFRNADFFEPAGLSNPDKLGDVRFVASLLETLTRSVLGATGP